MDNNQLLESMPSPLIAQEEEMGPPENQPISLTPAKDPATAVTVAVLEKPPSQVESAALETAPVHEPKQIKQKTSAPTEKASPAQSAEEALKEQEEKEKLAAEMDAQVQLLWHSVIEKVRSIPNQSLLVSFMKEVKPISWRNNNLCLGISDDFAKEHELKLRQTDSVKIINKCLRLVSGSMNAEVQFTNISESFLNSERRKLTASDEVWNRVRDNSFVKKVCDNLDGEIVDVRG